MFNPTEFQGCDDVLQHGRRIIGLRVTVRFSLHKTAQIAQLGNPVLFCPKHADEDAVSLFAHHEITDNGYDDFLPINACKAF
jgi:hypothetical protein